MDLNSKLFGNDVVDQRQSVPLEETPHSSIGHLNVFVHEARDIYNICIYHQQDSYAKLCLTSNPEGAMSSKTITYAGTNPVFNESLCLDVRTLESSLKCEIWMLSKAQEYLKDQLLGLCLVPLSDVILANGRLEKEFVLSSTEIFHSPAGFVKLSIFYDGPLPDVMTVSRRDQPLIEDAAMAEQESDGSIPSAYEKLEFPDLNVANENRLMVSELLGIPPTCIGSHGGAESVFTLDGEHCPNNEAGLRMVESFSTDNSSIGNSGTDTPRSCVSTSLSSSSNRFPASASRTNNDKGISEEEADSSAAGQSDVLLGRPLININLEPEETVVRKDIIDMYSESMQEFEKILANLKLPMDTDDTERSRPESRRLDSEQRSSSGSSSRVYYGSRAFF